MGYASTAYAVAGSVLLGVLIVLVLYAAYINGLVAVAAHRAVFFTYKKAGASAKFKSCTGKLRTVILAKENGPFTLTFVNGVTKGNVSVDVKNSSKEAIGVLSVESSSLTINAAEGDRFYLVINFNGADGEYVIEKNITN
ncbi:MAG: hypothetical protein MJ123_05530 [Lachnospiraceae bacterium]|nr:hypothetical protein [Lachnospiraceae bacterium]